MNMLLRLYTVALRSRSGRRLGHWDVCRTRFWVNLFDLDVLMHMNNGRYFSIMDLGRFDLMMRTGMWKALSARGWYPVVASQNITYRKSLTLGQRFLVETRLVGYNEKSAFIEQRFTVKGEIYAQAYIRARFLKKSGGTLSIAEVNEALDIGDAPAGALPDWVQHYSEASTLPPTRAEAPSRWTP